MNYQTDLAKAKGHGSAQSGFSHWWLQRMTAVLMLPTGVYVLWQLLTLENLAAANMAEWMKDPIHAGMLLVFVLSASYHGALGLQVVIEDYVPNKSWHLILRTLVYGAMIALIFFSCFAVFKLLFG